MCVIKRRTTKVFLFCLRFNNTLKRAVPRDSNFINKIQFISIHSIETAKLAKDGVKIIIALGHSGYPKDQDVARDCPLVDVIIGAHSHSFLYTGTPPEPDPVKGPYPTVVERANGKKVLIVQAYEFSKYLGELQLSVSAQSIDKQFEEKNCNFISLFIPN